MQGQLPTMEQNPTQEAQMEMMVKMMTEQHKAQDKIYFESGEKIENDEFEAALLHYCAIDKEVSQAM